MAINLEGLIKIISSIIPNNLNPKLWTIRNEDILGGPQNFATLQKLVDFHPFKMVKGMRGTVQDFPTAGKSTDFKMMADPAFMTDSNDNTIVTVDNYGTFWQELATTTPASVRVYNYAPDGPGGGSPIFPYEIGEESNWVPEFNAQSNHRWLRFRDDDVDANADTIFDNWTVPISLNAFQSGDYVENRFQRYAMSNPDVDITTIGGLEDLRHYVINQGIVTLNSVDLEVGARFTYNAGDVVVFDTVILRETNIAPPRTVSGLPNNEPSGWDDVPTAGVETLWMITGQKSVYGQLKSEWVIRRIEETPNYVRYSYTAEPDPNTLCSTTESAGDGTGPDTDLIAGGWIKTFTDQTFMAFRDDVSPGVFTAWQIEKISGESGEYIDNVFKLYSINMDPDSPSVVAPVTRTPVNEGWSDVPLVETAVDINFISTARKFFDGTLKTAWSAPVPYTGRSTYQDINVASPGDEFKIDPNAIPAVTEPSLITVINKLFKGADKVWEEDVTMTFVWKRVFNDGSIVDDLAGELTGFEYLGESGTPATEGYFFANQRVTITPEAVTGKAVFRCTTTLVTGGDDDLIFEEEISILDITDGKDAKSLSVTADNQLIIYDSVATDMVPLNILLRAYFANLSSPTLYWYHWTGSVWNQIAAGVDTYTALATTGGGAGSGVPPYFTEDASAEEARFAVSTHNTNPDSADFIATFSDYITIGKTSAAGIGSPGVDSTIALLDNESHTVVIDNTLGTPFSGEIGVAGKAITKVEIWDGTTKLSLADSGADVDMVIVSDNGDIDFVRQYGDQGSDPEKFAEVYVDSWLAEEISAVCTITLTYATKVYIKKFSISSTADAPGAIILDIDATGGFEWTVDDRNNKTVNGNLYDTNVLQLTGYKYRWSINGTPVSLPNLGSPTTDFDEDNREVTIARNLVISSATILCETYPSVETPANPIQDTPGFRSRTVKFTDVLDNQSVIAWTDYATATAAEKIPDGTDPADLSPSGIVAGSATWRSSSDIYWATHQAEFQCFAEELTTGWVWTSPQDFRGEEGDQGPNGDYFFNMYKADGTSVPSSNANMSTMRAAGWLRLPAVIGIIYQTSGRFNGEDNPPLGDGYPQNSAVPEDSWGTPVKLTGTDGTPGSDGGEGLDGNKGWSPSFAVVSDGSTREVLKLVDWVGGEGAKPGNIGDYIGNTGFVSTKGAAVNVRGTNGTDGIAEGLQEVDFQTSGSITDDGIKRQFSVAIELTTLIGSKTLGFTGAIEIYGGNFAAYEVEFLSSSTLGGSYGFKQRIRILADAGAVSSAPQNIAFHMIYADSNKFHKINIKRISGSANTIVGCMVEGKIYS